MSLIIESYNFYGNRVLILVEVQIFTYKIMLVSTVLTNVQTCFVVLAGIFTIHSPCLKHEKTVFTIYFCRTPFN